MSVSSSSPHSRPILIHLIIGLEVLPVPHAPRRCCVWGPQFCGSHHRMPPLVNCVVPPPQPYQPLIPQGTQSCGLFISDNPAQHPGLSGCAQKLMNVNDMRYVLWQISSWRKFSPLQPPTNLPKNDKVADEQRQSGTPSTTASLGVCRPCLSDGGVSILRWTVCERQVLT